MTIASTFHLWLEHLELSENPLTPTFLSSGFVLIRDWHPQSPAPVHLSSPLDFDILSDPTAGVTVNFAIALTEDT